MSTFTAALHDATSPVDVAPTETIVNLLLRERCFNTPDCEHMSMVVLAAIGEEEASKQVIEAGADLAAAYDEELVVVHVIPDEAVDEHIRKMRERPGYPDSGVSEEADRAANFAKSVVDATLDQTQQGRVRAEGRVGKPELQIRSLAEELDARCLVIGGRGRSPVGKAMFGSTTQSILLQSDRPVLTIRTPDDS